MKYQNLHVLSWKNKKTMIRLSSAEFAYRLEKVNPNIFIKTLIF